VGTRFPLTSVFIDIGWLLFRLLRTSRTIFLVKDLTTQLLECVHETMMQAASDLLRNGIELTSYQNPQPQQPAAVGFALILTLFLSYTPVCTRSCSGLGRIQGRVR
jgi:hypothetical protein